MDYYTKGSLVRVVVSLIFLPLSFYVNAERYSVEKIYSGDYTQESTDTQHDAQTSSFKGDDDQSSAIEKKISIFEQKYIESEKTEGAKILKSISAGGGLVPYDATEVNPLDFVDADDVEKYGGTPRGGKVPYYITVDEFGRPRNVSYDPDAVKEALNKQKDTTLDYTQASIFERSASDNKSLGDLPSSADPVAVAILSSGEFEAQPDYFEAHINLGIYWDNRGDFTKAISLFKKAIQIQPQNAEGYFTLANSFYNNKKWEEAINNYRIALKLKPELTQARLNLDIVLRQVGNKK